MARGFGRHQRNVANIVIRLTLKGLGSLLYMIKGKPSSALTRLILELWLTQLSQLLKVSQATTTLDLLGYASPDLCPDCGALLPISRGCRSQWHLNRPPGKFERAARDFQQLLSSQQLLVNKRDYDNIVRVVGDPVTRYIASTPDVPSEASFYETWFKQGQEIKGKYRWMYDD
jgi:hypothetical protein